MAVANEVTSVSRSTTVRIDASVATFDDDVESSGLGMVGTSWDVVWDAMPDE
jgi:hypothetical protein